MTSATQPSAPRILGYDLARALAILGMVIVHFTLVMSFERLGHGALSHLVEFLDGRAAATFVVLAGVGLTLRSRGPAAAGDDASLRAVRITLIKRGLFLLAVGYVNLLIWAGDILRVYGVSLLLAAWCLRTSGRALLLLTLAFVAGFVALMLAFDYSANWNWDTLEYRGLWTPSGIVRNLFYDGFRTVFPWTGLLFFGMWLGRQPLQLKTVGLRFFTVGMAACVAAEIASRLLLRSVLANHPDVSREDAVALFGTTSMPPLPLFLLSAVGTSIAVITSSIWIAERYPLSWPVQALVATGQLAFTWYVAHIVLGLGTVIALGLTEDRPLAMGVAAGVGFFGMASVVSFVWRRRFRHGPLEWLMRRVAG